MASTLAHYDFTQVPPFAHFHVAEGKVTESELDVTIDGKR